MDKNQNTSSSTEPLSTSEGHADQNAEMNLREDLQTDLKWPPDSLKTLRLRMGFSQCDLARQLSISTELVRVWEEGRQEVSQECAARLHVLFNQAEMCSHEIYSQPLAESELEKNDLGQIESSTI